jgi:hypothetical protein
MSAYYDFTAHYWSSTSGWSVYELYNKVEIDKSNNNVPKAAVLIFVDQL